MSAAGFLLRGQLCRQWRRVLVLGMMLGLVGGIVTAAVLGAERSRSSLPRFIDAVGAADVGVFVQDQAQLDPVVDHPDVERVGRFSMPALFPTAVLDGDVFIPFAASLDGAMPYEFNSYRVLDGRMPDPGSATEIALHESTAAFLDVAVGDQLELAMFTEEALEQTFEDEEFPEVFETIDFDVVAVMRDPLDVIARPTDIVVTPLTPAAADRFVGELGSLGEGAFLGLRPGTDVAGFTADVADLAPEAEIERWVGGTDLADTGFGSTLDLIGDSLLAMAVVVAVAGALVVGQALWRAATGSRHERDVLRSLGLERRATRALDVAPGLAVALLGAVGTALVAVGVSPLFPIGIARRAEPDPGVEVEAGILVGAGAVLVVGFALALAAGVLAGRRPNQPAAARAARPNFDPVARVVGSGSASLARSTQVAVAFGGLAVAAALVFAASVEHLLRTPAHYGWTFDAAVVSETNDATVVADGVDVAADPAVAEAADALFQIQLTINGLPGLGYAIGDGTGSIGPVVARGRPPAQADEVALGRETMRQLGVGIGDDVTIAGEAGPEAFRVVGQAIIPVSSDGGRVGNGATFVTPALPRLGVDGPEACEQSSCYRQVVVRWHDGADLGAAADRMLAEGSSEFVRPVPPPEVERLSEVDAMPWIVAGLLTVLAAAAAVHAVVVTVQRRRRDLAVLRTLGVTPGRTRRAVSLHVLGLVGVWAVVGAGLGVVVGRTVWRAVAHSVGVAAVPDVPVLAVLLLPVAALLLTQVAAAIPAGRAARLRPTQVLRSE